MSCSTELVEMLDKIDLEKKEEKKLGLTEIRKLLPKEKYVEMNIVFQKVIEDGIITMTAQEKKVYKYRQLPVNYYHNKIEWILMKTYCSIQERLDIMKATASTHIQEINEVHTEYGDMIRKLKEENKKENDKLKCEINYLKCMMKNMILSLVYTEDDDLEWNVKNDYGMNYSDEYNKYKNTVMKEQIEEMNDTDWNEDGEMSILEYGNKDEIIYIHFKDED